MPSRSAQAQNTNARNANVVPLVPDKKVLMHSFITPIQLLSQNMTIQNNQQVQVPTNTNDRLVAAIVCDIFMMNSPKFLGLQVGKDP